MSAGDLRGRIVEALTTAYDVEGIVALYRPDALFEMNAPQWRYQLQGPAGTLERAREELSPYGALKVRSSRVVNTEDGMVVETEVGFGNGDGAGLWREVHILRTDGERITEHTIYCTGDWDAARIAEHAAEAPMVRP